MGATRIILLLTCDPWLLCWSERSARKRASCHRIVGHAKAVEGLRTQAIKLTQGGAASPVFLKYSLYLHESKGHLGAVAGEQRENSQSLGRPRRILFRICGALAASAEGKSASK